LTARKSNFVTHAPDERRQERQHHNEVPFEHTCHGRCRAARLIAGLVGEKCSHDHAKVGGQTISRMRWNEPAMLKFETRTELQPAA
jgi:hypothetical protein